ncbi:MAG: acetylglutamate kinase [Rikenellaceae bacterium]
MQELTVVKIGGNVVDNPTLLSSFLKEFALIGSPKILVHGGGKIATTISKALGIESTMIGGRRVTDERTLDVVTQVYAGLINKKIVASLQSFGSNSFGLCGVDGASIISKRRAVEPIDFGFVGDPVVSKFGVSTFTMLLNNGCVPIVAPITLSTEGELLNTNADTVAQTVAVALSKIYNVRLIYCFEKKGVLLNVDDENSVIEAIDFLKFQELRAHGVVSEGMLPKLENAFEALKSGVDRVIIRSSSDLLNGIGTTLFM